MSKIKRDWEREAPPINRRLREIQEREWEQELEEYIIEAKRKHYDREDIEERERLWRS